LFGRESLLSEGSCDWLLNGLTIASAAGVFLISLGIFGRVMGMMSA
jgi:hypothetical protein